METLPVTFSRWTMRKLLLRYAIQNIRPRWLWLYPPALFRLAVALIRQQPVKLEIGITTIGG